MTLKRNPNFNKILDDAEKKGLILASDFLVIKIREKLNRSGGISSPGESPMKQSGDLYDSIQTNTSEISAKRVRIGSDEDYAAAQEGGTIDIQPRPFLRPGYRDNKAGVLREFNKGGKNK